MIKVIICYTLPYFLFLFRLPRRKGLERSTKSERTRNSVAAMELDQEATSGALGELLALSRKSFSIISGALVDNFHWINALKYKNEIQIQIYFRFGRVPQVRDSLFLFHQL